MLHSVTLITLYQGNTGIMLHRGSYCFILGVF